MDESDKQSGEPVARKTLKLKSPPTPRATAAPRPAPPASPGQTTSSPPAAQPFRPSRKPSQPVSWADEHKHRMQADMDALCLGTPAPPPERGRR